VLLSSAQTVFASVADVRQKADANERADFQMLSGGARRAGCGRTKPNDAAHAFVTAHVRDLDCGNGGAISTGSGAAGRVEICCNIYSSADVLQIC
jgi:hypothetical protein